MCIRDRDKGILTETEAQELIDHLTMKFRMVEFARIPSYNQLFSGKALLKACTNGSSELMTNLSASLVGALYNWQLLRLGGADGVAA